MNKVLKVFQKGPSQINSEVKAMQKDLFKFFTGFQVGITQMNYSLKDMLETVDHKTLSELKNLGYKDEINQLMEMYASFERFQKFYEEELKKMKLIVQKKG
jgi:ERCC4-type nuclease